MKKVNTFLILLMIASGFMVSCTHQTKENNDATTIAMKGDPASETKTAVPIMTFAETKFDFGTVTEGDILKHTFSFTNTGNAPLVIVNAKGSCGCTVSDWPKQPIAPGETKEMRVAFNTNGKPNAQNKQVTITTNTTAGKHILKIKAMVTPKAKSLVSGAPISK